MYELEIPNLKKLEDLLKRYPQIAEKRLQEGITIAAAEIMKNATRDTVPWKTGNLVHSFGTAFGRLFAYVGPNRFSRAPYAYGVHEGTKPHIIRPVHAKALFWPGASHPVAQVNHPGSKPNRFMPRIMAKSRPAVDKTFQLTAEKILKDLQL